MTMKLTRVLPVVVLGAGLLAVGAAASGALPLPHRQEVARPSCAKLPSAGTVDRALSAHPALVRRIEGTGSDVHVSLARPCTGQPDRGIVRVTVGDSGDRARLDRLLGQEAGFGVPLEVVEA
jgi:hypothetical protein